MALPSSLSTCSLQFGAYADLTGAVAFAGLKGTLTVSPPLLDVGTGDLISQPIVFAISGSGTATVGPIPHTDDPALTPGSLYTVQWQVASYKPSPGNLTFALPRSLGSVVDFDLLTYTQVTPPSSSVAVVGSALVGAATVA